MTPAGLKQLKIDESSLKDHLKAYKDSRGIWTIGHGFNLQEPANRQVFKGTTGFPVEEAIGGRTITTAQQDALLMITVKWAEEDARELVMVFDRLTPAQQDAIVNFVFNVGYNTAKTFKNTIGAINRYDGAAAGKGLRNSAYYKQVGTRGERVAKVFDSIKKP